MYKAIDNVPVNCDAQLAMIIEYAKTHRGITHQEANDHLGCGRLSARIYDIKALGFDVTVVMESGTNRFGRPTRYARYFISAPKKKTGESASA